jgi:hypothetical protein
MFSCATVVVTFALLPFAAGAWADSLRRDNAQLTQQVESLELDIMVAQYQSGRSVRVEGIGQRGDSIGQDMTKQLQQLRDFYQTRLKAEILQGRTSPEALIGILRRRAEVEALDKRFREFRIASDPFAKYDRGRFPELAELRRANYTLRDRKHRLAAELSQLQGNSPKR